MPSAIAAVISVPATSGHAPKISFDGFQSFVVRNDKTPWWLNAGCALLMRKTKKNAISARLNAASPARIARKSGSGGRGGRGAGRGAAVRGWGGRGGGRRGWWWPSAPDGGAVALHRVDHGL